MNILVKMQVGPEEADLDHKIRMFAGSVAMLAIGPMSAEGEGETAGKEAEEEISEEGVTQEKDADHQTDINKEEAAEATQERMNEEREDVSVASKEVTSRHTAQKEVAVGTQGTDMKTEEEIVVEIVEELVAMVAETWLEMAVGMETPVVIFLVVAHL